jgi:hypothetical protein
VIGREQAAGARHILDENGRLTRNIPGHMPREHSRQSIVAAAGRKPDDDAYGFSLVKICLGNRALDAGGHIGHGDSHGEDHFCHSNSPLLITGTLITALALDPCAGKTTPQRRRRSEPNEN